ncbi:MAG: DUF2391 family protein [Aquificae bacterium]|nr:DUF2391 family protein [Aquificota bacterium]
MEGRKSEKPEGDLEKLTHRLEVLEREIEDLAEELKGRPRKLSFDDLVQELAGAVAVAIAVSLSEEIWELATRLSLLHALLVYLFVLLVANLFVRYGNPKQWARQTVLGFIQLRLLTSAAISFAVSALVVLLLGIYPAVVDEPLDYLKVVLLVSSLSLIGSLGLDLAK